jgi:hypothetical protein
MTNELLIIGHCFYCSLCRGADQDRTDDLFIANEALSQTELQPHDIAQMYAIRISNANNFYRLIYSDLKKL